MPIGNLEEIINPLMPNLLRKDNTNPMFLECHNFYYYYCGLEGHIKVDCRKRDNDLKSNDIKV